MAEDQGTGELGASSDGWSPSALPPPPPPPFATATAAELPGPHMEPPAGRRGRVVIALVAVVGLVGAGLAVALSGSDGVDPEKALAGAQAAVEDEGSFRFDVRTVYRSTMGDADGPGSDTTTRTVTTGELAQPDRWRLITDDGIDPELGGMGRYEMVRVADRVFTRTEATTLGPPWVEGPADMYEQTPENLAEWYGSMEEMEDEDDVPDPFLAASRLDLLMASYLMDFDDGSPDALTRLVTEATDPEAVEGASAKGVRLTAQLAPIPELEAVAEDDLPPVTVTLDLDDAGLPVVVAFSAETEGASAEVEVRFSDWGADIDIDAPDLADIDATPWLSEEALAEWPQLLIVPTSLPDGFELNSAVLMEEPSDAGCPTVYLDYATEAAAELMAEPLSPTEMEEAWSEVDSLTLMASPASCAEEWDPTPFDDVFAGLPARGEPGYREVRIGEVWLIVSSTLDDAVVESLAGTLGPVTLDELAASIPAWVTAGWG